MNAPFREHEFRLPETYRPRTARFVVATVMTVVALLALIAAPVLSALAILGGAP